MVEGETIGFSIDKRGRDTATRLDAENTDGRREWFLKMGIVGSENHAPEW